MVQPAPECNGMGCGHWSVINGYAGKHSSDPEWIMQDPRGLPDMVNGGHSNPFWGVMQASVVLSSILAGRLKVLEQAGQFL